MLKVATFFPNEALLFTTSLFAIFMANQWTQSVARRRRGDSLNTLQKVQFLY